MTSSIMELEQQIRQAADAYYNGTSIINDDEFDALMYQLRTLDPTNKLLTTVGAEPTTEEWKKEKHLFPLGSLDKVNTPQEMSEWISDKLGNRSVMVVEKLDGLSIGCQYDNGRLTKALLRGGGEIGENILQNVLKMHGVVKNIPNFTGVLRGEIILTKTNHQLYFPTYSNPRNAASGLCRRLDGEGVQHLTLMVYQVLGEDFDTEYDQFEFMIKAGCIVPNHKLCTSADEVNQLWQEYQDTTRASLDYEIDGLVVGANDLAFQLSLGEHDLRPKGKRAFKFANQFVKTTVTQIQFQVGNSGRITPVCWFEPVNLLGSMVQKASAYNVAYIEKLGLDIGAEVLICKAGEIIPRVEQVVKTTGTVVSMPDECPACGSFLEMVGENLMCLNTIECPAQVQGRLQNWVKGINILEWGSELLVKLVASDKVNTIADLYKLTVEDLASLERMGKRSAKKCHDTLWASKMVPLDIFLGSLSIPFVGVTIIKLVMNSGLNTLNQILNASQQDFEAVKGMGSVKSASLFTGLKNNREIINQLLAAGLTIKENNMSEGKLAGKSFVVTGKTTIKRAVLQTMIEEAGGVYKGSVGKGLDFLVAAKEDSTSTKANKAREQGTAIISEDELLVMING